MTLSALKYKEVEKMSKIITKKVLAQSLKLLMADRPFAKISVDDICQAAGISRRNFYRHFPDKYDLLNWIYHEDYLSKIVLHDDWNVWDYFPLICEYCYKDRVFFKNAFQIEGQNSPRAYWREMLYPFIMHDFKDTFLSKQSADFYIAKVTDALFDYMLIWLKSAPCKPPDEFAAFVRKSIAIHAKRTWEITAQYQTDA